MLQVQRLKIIAILALCAGVSCGGAPRGQGALAGAQAPTSGATVLGTLDGLPLTVDNLPPLSRERLADVEGEYAQRRYQLLWTALEDMVSDRLLADEARKRGTSLAQLLDAEVESKVGAPSDAEIRGLYEANKEIIKVPLATAAPYLKDQWHAERVLALRRALVDHLRGPVDVQYSIPPPALPTFDVQPGHSPTSGPPNAKATLVVFSDYQCPFSAQVRRLLHRLGEIYPTQIRIVLRNFPLDQHPQAQRAAEAATCAVEQNKFWPFYDTLFENNEALQEADLRRYAEQGEFNMPAYDACMASDRPKNAVLEDVTEAARVGVRATPVIFINGKRIKGVLPLPLMQQLIDRKLGV